MRGKYMRKLICCMLVAMMGVTQLCSVVSQAADISRPGFRVPASHCFDFGSRTCRRTRRARFFSYLESTSQK